ncbi:MAG: sugar transferase [Actinomycetota bacterium]
MTQPIRVLYLDHVVHLSGAEQSLFDLVVGLAGGPVEPIVVLPDDGPLATQLRASGVLVRKVKMSKRLLDTSRKRLNRNPLTAIARLVSFLAVSFRLRSLIKETKPHVIHTNTLKTHLLAIIPAKLSHTPLVWHMRDILPQGWLRKAFILCARFPNRIVVTSRAVAQSLGANKSIYRKLALIPNGIRVDSFEDRDEGISLREEIGAGPKDLVVGIVGRIAPWKGQDIFVHSAAMLAERHPKVRFAIIGAPMFGDDAFQHELASLVYQYQLDGQLMFTGWRSAQEAMSALDIMVHASVEPEPFGRTIIEAMAAGLPIVAAGGGAIQEILPPNAGFTVPPGHPEILADALETLLSDRALRKEMGRHGREAAARYFDVRRTIAAIGALYVEGVRASTRDAAKRAQRFAMLAMLKKRFARKKQTLPATPQYNFSRPPMRPQMRPNMQARPMQPRRRPPVLRPEAPDQAPARPKRRMPIDEEMVRPVRRSAHIEEPPARKRPPAPAATQRRVVPALKETTLVEERRRVTYVNGHVIKRPLVLDEPDETIVLDSVRDSVLDSVLDSPIEEKIEPVVRKTMRSAPRVSVEATAPVLEPEIQKPVPIVEPVVASVVAPLGIPVRSRPVYEALKRIMDILVSLVVLVVGSPLWIAVALLIKLDSRGPALFKGTVWGKDCAPFTYYKFRSMRTDGPDHGHRQFIEQYVKTDGGVASESGKQVFKFVADSRITRVGKLIRKLSIDEIPQLVNVLKGDMSLVGPRPPLQYEFELYDEWAKQRLAVRPGMTGLQQTYARHSAAFTEKVEMDLAYIRERSLWLDLTILAKTIPAAFKGE